MNDMDDSQSRPAAKSKRDRWVKLGFLVAVLLVAAVVYFSHRKEPGLESWETCLDSGLQQAKQNQTKVIVFFTRQPMGYWDKRMVKKCMQMGPTTRVLRHLGYVTVHLTIQANRQEVERFEVMDTPTVLLLDANGKLLKRHTGFMNDISFCNQFLGLSAKQISE
ncbi:MAG: hypothetical protein SVT52_09055 [Planctomycetota bacterium]|nr:hypothetical protein [Planctomycetota bacterium]